MDKFNSRFLTAFTILFLLCFWGGTILVNKNNKPSFEELQGEAVLRVVSVQTTARQSSVLTALKVFASRNSLVNYHDMLEGTDENYLFFLDFSARLVAVDSGQVIVGPSLANARDSSGKYFIRELVARCVNNRSGQWVNYSIINLVNGSIIRKAQYVERMESAELCVSTGVRMPPFQL